MKKLLWILVLGLLLSGNVFSKTISSYEDLDLTSKPKNGFIDLNDDINGLGISINDEYKSNFKIIE